MLKSLFFICLLTLTAAVSAKNGDSFNRIVSTLKQVDTGSCLINVSGNDYRLTSSACFHDMYRKKGFTHQLIPGKDAIVEFKESAGSMPVVKPLRVVTNQRVSD